MNSACWKLLLPNNKFCNIPNSACNLLIYVILLYELNTLQPIINFVIPLILLITFNIYDYIPSISFADALAYY